LDGEVLFKSNYGELLSFQEIEKKTKNIVQFDDKYPCLYLFDIMHINDQSLVSKDQALRRQYLEQYFPPKTQNDSDPLSKHVQTGEARIINLADSGAEEAIKTMKSESLEGN
jgi:ATP-dependent DNA ligase